VITQKYLLDPVCNTWSRDDNFDYMGDCRRLRHVLDRLNPLYVNSGRVAGSRPIENRADSNSTNFRPSSRAHVACVCAYCACARDVCRQQRLEQIVRYLCASHVPTSVDLVRSWIQHNSPNFCLQNRRHGCLTVNRDKSRISRMSDADTKRRRLASAVYTCPRISWRRERADYILNIFQNLLNINIQKFF